ncbi:MAG TPA: lipid-binding SYLF domain-containing protein [Gemmatimonadaceae bacterium]|nr:lipid-binding SYLF domain-containing protein [Gemmatimonadaceae bacterium]
MKRSPSRSADRSVARFTRAFVALAIVSQLFVTVAGAQDKSDEKLSKRAQRASEVLSELVSVPDRSPPKSLLNSATCIAVIPGVVQAGLGVGGRFGFGVASCRTSSGWSAPVFVGLKGGSFGFQIGGQSADVVLVFVNKDAARLASSTFDIGAGASVAAGPVGRNVSAETDYKAKAEIYSYSKTKGLFAGISLSGTKWESDYDANKQEYGTSTSLPNGGDSKSVGTILTTDGSAAPADLRVFVESLQKNVGDGKDQ